MTNTIDPAAVSAARERVARFEARATALLKKRGGGWHAINRPVAVEDIEAMRLLLATVAARDEASEAVRVLTESSSGTWAFTEYRESYMVQRMIDRHIDIAHGKTLPAAILALRQAVQQGKQR